MRLTLSPKKTAITHVDDGFDFLGWRVKRWHRPGRVPRDHVPERPRARGHQAPHQGANRARHDEPVARRAHPRAQSNPSRWTNYHRHGAAKRCFGYLSYYLWWRVIRWLRKKYPRLTWKQIKRRCWGRKWTSKEGTRLHWPADVPVTRFQYRGHQIPTPWTPTTPPHQATGEPSSA